MTRTQRFPGHALARVFPCLLATALPAAPPPAPPGTGTPPAGFDAQFRQLCETACREIDSGKRTDSFYRDSYAIRALAAAYDAIANPAYLETCRRWAARKATIDQKRVGAARVAEMVRRYANEFDVPVVLHLDHGKDFESVKAAIDNGYSSVMIDGSSLPYDDNVEITREVVLYAHALGVSVEGELDVLAGMEEHVIHEQSTYTDPNKVVDFFLKTRCDALVECRTLERMAAFYRQGRK